MNQNRNQIHQMIQHTQINASFILANVYEIKFWFCIFIFWSKNSSSSSSLLNADSISRYWYSLKWHCQSILTHQAQSNLKFLIRSHLSSVFINQWLHTNCRKRLSLLTNALIVQRWFVHSHLYQQVNSFNVKNSFMSLLNGLQPFSISLFNNCSIVILSLVYDIKSLISLHIQLFNFTCTILFVLLLYLNQQAFWIHWLVQGQGFNSLLVWFAFISFEPYIFFIFSIFCIFIIQNCFLIFSYYFKKDDKRSNGRNDIESNIRITLSSGYCFRNSANISSSALNLSTSILSVSHNRSMNKYFLLNISDSKHCILFSFRSCLVIGSLFVSISNWFNNSTSFL